jgi:hypothetical protein
VAEIDPIIKELENTASVHRPSRQNLLFAGRDHLKRVLQAEKPPKEIDSQAVLFERRLQAAQMQFGEAQAGGAQAGKAGAGRGVPPLVKGTR